MCTVVARLALMCNLQEGAKGRPLHILDRASIVRYELVRLKYMNLCDKLQCTGVKT